MTKPANAPSPTNYYFLLKCLTAVTAAAAGAAAYMALTAKKATLMTSVIVTTHNPIVPLLICGAAIFLLAGLIISGAGTGPNYGRARRGGDTVVIMDSPEPSYGSGWGPGWFSGNNHRHSAPPVNHVHNSHVHGAHSHVHSHPVAHHNTPVHGHI